MVSKRLASPDHTAPNKALEPTPYSVRYAPAFGRGSPPALGAYGVEEKTQEMP